MMQQTLFRAPSYAELETLVRALAAGYSFEFTELRDRAAALLDPNRCPSTPVDWPETSGSGAASTARPLDGHPQEAPDMVSEPYSPVDVYSGGA